MSEAAREEEPIRSLRRAEFVAERAQMARRPIPELIELLASSELKIRFLAEMCLRDATAT
jgi:hypothetical protein